MEKKIIENVYKLESKKVMLTLIRYLSFTFFSIVSIYLLSTTVYKILYEQQTLDLLEILKEDLEIIKEFLPDVLEILYMEMPKLPFFFLLIFCLVLSISILLIINNSGKIKNRLHSLYKYFYDKKNRKE